MPNIWKKYKLGDLTTKITKGTTPSTVGGKFLSSGVNYIKSEAVDYDGRIDTSTFVYIDADTHEKLKRSQLEENDILFSIAGIYLGKTGMVTKEMIPANTNQAVAIIRLNQLLANPKFIHLFLRNSETVRYVNSMSSQSAQPNINLEEVGSLELNLPPLPEQKAIAEILSSLDDKIELNLQTNKTLEEMANALYKHWFVDFGPFNDGKFIESELGLIPEGFKLVSFKDVCFNHSKTYNFKGKEKVIFVNTGDILEGKFLHKNYSDIEGLPGQAKKIIELNDILFSEIRPGNKRYALIISDTSEYVVSTKFMVIRTNEKILPRILYRILRDEAIIKEFQNIAESRSGTFPQITFDAISGITFPMSNIGIQNQFMDKVLPLEQLIESNNIEIENLKQTRDYLLPKLISGEIQVKDAAKKVKEVL